jgi:hypothetical protein
MKRLPVFAAGVAFLFATGAVMFGDVKSESSRVRGVLPQNWSKLGLTDQQKQQIYSVQNEYRAKIDEMQKQINALRRKERGEMEKILTDAQKARLREVITEKISGGASKVDKKGDEKATPEKK